MIIFFICLLISIMTSCGMAVVAVEKGSDYPVKKPRVLLKKFLHDHISWKFCQVLDCTTCTSFWTTFLSDMVVGIIACLHGEFYFFWPFSGFIACGFTWFIIELLNAFDSKIED